MAAQRNFDKRDFLSLLRRETLSTGEIARKIKCDKVTALKYLKELKAEKRVIETRISSTSNVWQLNFDNQILIGDCAETLKGVETESVDLIVTDPPYGYSFMGLDWDKALPSLAALKECCRVLKAGAFGFFMCAPRQDCLGEMIHLLNRAGFETGFSSIYWTYATGFPKVSDTSKLIDKRADAEREVIGVSSISGDRNNAIEKYGWDQLGGTSSMLNNSARTNYITAPSTEQAKKFNGSYSPRSLKPAVEVIIVVLKPLSERTYVDQALTNSHGVLWLDDCRIPYAHEIDINQQECVHFSSVNVYGKYTPMIKNINPDGRFPSNLLVSDDALNNGIITTSRYGDVERDTGSYSRYFDLDKWFASKLPKEAESTYPCFVVPKPTASERNKYAENKHPTVKPLKLMSYLITMGSREGDLVLDPFAGSGTTLEAANTLKRRFIGCERDEKWKPLIEARAFRRTAVKFG